MDDVPIERVRVVAHVPEGANVFDALDAARQPPPLEPDRLARVQQLGRDMTILVPGILLADATVPEDDDPLAGFGMALDGLGPWKAPTSASGSPKPQPVVIENVPAMRPESTSSARITTRFVVGAQTLRTHRK